MLGRKRETGGVPYEQSDEADAQGDRERKPACDVDDEIAHDPANDQSCRGAQGDAADHSVVMLLALEFWRIVMRVPRERVLVSRRSRLQITRAQARAAWCADAKQKHSDHERHQEDENQRSCPLCKVGNVALHVPSTEGVEAERVSDDA